MFDVFSNERKKDQELHAIGLRRKARIESDIRNVCQTESGLRLLNLILQTTDADKEVFLPGSNEYFYRGGARNVGTWLREMIKETDITLYHKLEIQRITQRSLDELEMNNVR